MEKCICAGCGNEHEVAPEESTVRNNREIKFRAWDKFKKLFIPQDVYAVVNRDDGAFGILLKDWQEYEEGEFFYEEAQELSQFTGLKDKNGKPIYEGDVVRNPGGFNYTIEFKDGTFVPTYQGQPYWHKQFEVIGNRFENPELISA